MTYYLSYIEAVFHCRISTPVVGTLTKNRKKVRPFYRTTLRSYQQIFSFSFMYKHATRYTVKNGVSTF